MSVPLTVALGALMAVNTWLGADWSSPPWLGFAATLSVILVPVIVGRWWVVLALTGQVIAFGALQLTDHPVRFFESEMSALPLGFVAVVVDGLFMLALVAARKGFDLWRRRRVAAAGGGDALT